MKLDKPHRHFKREMQRKFLDSLPTYSIYGRTTVDSVGTPVPQDDQVVSFCLFDRIRKTQCKSYLPMPGFKVKS